jgi:hypothetical protein
MNKTEGIDFGVFLRATVTPLPDDAAEISVFDGQHVRVVKAVPVDFQLSSATRENAQKAGFKIKIS